MKKFIVFSCSIIIILSVISCSINSESTFYKDKTSTTEMNVDMRGFYEIMKDSMFAGGARSKMKTDQFPKNYTSFYDLQMKKEPREIPADSVKLYKKMFMRSNFENNEIVGFSLKLDRFSPEDAKLFGSREENDLSMQNNMIENWDGKTLKINTSNFVSEDLSTVLGLMNGKDDKRSKEQAKIFKEKFPMKFSTILKFEAPIKKMIGKHPWVKKLDNNTVQISYSAEDINKASKKTLEATEITIETE